MNTAYFDCFSGISGDMAMGALMDLGVPAESVISELKKLPLKDWSLEVSRERRGAIEGTRVVISAKDQPHRSFSDIKAILAESGLDPWVKDKSVAIFERMAQAEGKVHGIDPAHVHFHEVGAIDSIMDTVGTVFCLSYLNIEKLYASPLPMGRGFIQTQHGTIPLPAPATVALLSEVPVYGTSIERELVTPTGAGIISTLATSFGQVPAMTLLSTGYGVGAHPSGDPPNLLRILLGEMESAAIVRELLMIETSIDDMNPEFYNYTLEKLFAVGALDVNIIPVQMKKNRPGVLLRVLVEPILEQTVAELLFTETTTLGIRVQDVKRIEVVREEGVIATRFGPCRVKRVFLPNGHERQIPEYEDCRRIAGETGLPIPDVYRQLLVESN
jgi:pyridinium-3,5-bisthiocarboxylic acid mononucleotide nickel chelatase